MAAKSGKTLDVVMLMGGPMLGVSGGDTHALRFIAGFEARWPGKARLVAPPSVKEYLPDQVQSSLLPLRTPLDSKIRNILVYAVIVLIRTVLASVRMPRARVVVASSHFFHDVIPCVVAKNRAQSSVVVFIYHLIDDMGRDAGIRSSLSKRFEAVSLWMLRRNADVVFVDNDEVQQSLVARGFEDDRIVMTANAFDPLVALPPRKLSEPPILTFLGRFVKEKGIWDVLDLARALAKTAPGARIEMVGDGPLHEEFARQLATTGLRNVELFGFVNETEKWALLRRSNLFLAPSREEGWGIAVGEALTAGTPVVAFDLPAYKYLGDSIVRIPTGDTAAFIAEVVRLLDNPAELAAAASALESSAGGLPTWDEILSAEYEVLKTHLLN